MQFPQSLGSTCGYLFVVDDDVDANDDDDDDDVLDPQR